MQANHTTDTPSTNEVMGNEHPTDVRDIIDDLELALERADWIQAISDAITRNPERAARLNNVIQFLSHEMVYDLNVATERAKLQLATEEPHATGAPQ